MPASGHVYRFLEIEAGPPPGSAQKQVPALLNEGYPTGPDKHRDRVLIWTG